MFKESATHDPVPFSVEIKGIKDAEGNAVERDQVEVQVETSDSAVLTADYDESTDTGEIQFGATGESLFSLKVVDKSDPDQVLAAYAVGFVLVAGDPESVESVSVSFEGISEVPVETPPIIDPDAPRPDHTLPGDLPPDEETPA